MAWRRRQSESQRRGFTIVELLIVVVVIAILAAISVVAYRGVASNAQAAAVKGNLAQAANKLEMYRVDNGGYPPDQAALTSLLNFDTSTNLTYAANNSTSPPTYCLAATQGTQQFSLSSTSTTPTATACVVNLANDPAATAAINYSVNGLYWTKSGWFGTGGGGTTSTVSGVSDGPTSAITTYARKVWSTSPTSSGDTGFLHTSVDTWATSSSSSLFAVYESRVYTASAYLRQTSSGSRPVRFDVRFFDASGNALGSTPVFGPSVTALSGLWYRVSCTFTVPAGAVKATMKSNVAGGPIWAPGDTLDGTGLMVTQGSTLYNYADGNSPGWGWTGTPNASTSIGPPL